MIAVLIALKQAEIISGWNRRWQYLRGDVYDPYRMFRIDSRLNA
jgi:hypothetical protein